MPPKADIKILIVDDKQTMRKIIKGMLRDLGYSDITISNNGALAWTELQEASQNGKPFEFIISDWSMPEMNGLELLKKIRSDDAYKTTPFLMITAEAEQSKVLLAVKAGVSNFIVKPFTTKILSEKINKINF
ncbi:MAG: response regulator [Bacteriovoracaceae bacterium]